MDAEAAMAAFRARVAPAAASGPPRGGLRQRLKSLARASALARRLLGFSVERTAAALTMLALTARPSGSSAAKRAEIQQRMLERLHSVAA